MRYCDEYFKKNPDQDARLDDNALNQHGFKRAHINHKTGTTNNQRPQVLAPKPVKEITVGSDDMRDCIEYIAGSGESNNYDTALKVGDGLVELLVSVPDKNRSDTMVLTNTPWNLKE